MIYQESHFGKRENEPGEEEGQTNPAETPKNIYITQKGVERRQYIGSGWVGGWERHLICSNITNKKKKTICQTKKSETANGPTRRKIEQNKILNKMLKNKTDKRQQTQ